MDQKFEISRGSVTVPKRRRDSREGRRRRGRDAAGDDINNKRIVLLCAAAQPRRREGDFSPRSPHPDSRCAEDSGSGGERRWRPRPSRRNVVGDENDNNGYTSSPPKPTRPRITYAVPGTAKRQPPTHSDLGHEFSHRNNLEL